MRLPRPISRATSVAPSLFAALLLASCAQDGPPPLPPLPEEAMAAVVTDPGVPREPLARAVDALFTADGVGETRAVLVMHNGAIVAERYAEGFDADMPLIGWSMSKTVTAVLTGIMVADGRLALDDPAPVAQWQRAGDPRGGITLRHLLQMRSGLDHCENCDPLYKASEVRMLFGEGRGDMAGWAKAQPLAAEPGTDFTYSSSTTVILADIITGLLAPDASPERRQRAMEEFVQTRLAEPLGMDSLVGEYDASGTLVGGSLMFATTRDWGKFGEFLRKRGEVGGVQVVPKGWVDFMVQSSPVSPDYGAQIWLNRNATDEDRDGFLGEQVSSDIYGMRGHLGQFVHVSPRQGLTIVRLGKSEGEEGAAAEQLMGDIFALYPLR